MYYPTAVKMVRDEYGKKWSAVSRHFRAQGLRVKRYPDEAPF